MQSRVTDDRFWISLGEFERRPVWKSAKYFTVSGRNTDRLCIGFVGDHSRKIFHTENGFVHKDLHYYGLTA